VIVFISNSGCGGTECSEAMSGHPSEPVMISGPADVRSSDRDSKNPVMLWTFIFWDESKIESGERAAELPVVASVVKTMTSVEHFTSNEICCIAPDPVEGKKSFPQDIRPYNLNSLSVWTWTDFSDIHRAMSGRRCRTNLPFTSS
jgi:hypothetical protein